LKIWNRFPTLRPRLRLPAPSATSATPLELSEKPRKEAAPVESFCSVAKKLFLPETIGKENSALVRGKFSIVTPAERRKKRRRRRRKRRFLSLSSALCLRRRVYGWGEKRGQRKRKFS
jgi:hypothetical protein